jgi:hypothetical protein
MLRLIPQAKENFVEKNIYIKLIRRFWKAMIAYEEGRTYAEVLNFFYSNHCSGAVVSHRKISNSNLDNI